MGTYGHIRLAVLALVAVALSSAVGQAQFLQLDPRLEWRVLETEHFSIIFPPGAEGLAREAAELAEEARQYWLEELKYSPPGKTAVVIVPGLDFDIGGAAPLPNRVIMLGTSSARSFSEWLNSRARSGLEQVIYHEYGHIVDISLVSGLSKLLQGIFGAIVLPNGTKPGFFVEGVVISAEERRSGASRANDPRNAMYLREMWLHGLLPGLDQLSQYLIDRRRWPSGYMLSHEIGAWLVRYLAEEYGPEKIAEIDKLNAESPLSALSFGFLTDFGGALRKALGVSPKEFLAGFKEWLKEQFQPQLERVEAEGIVGGQRIGKLAYWNNDPAWSPTGEWIAYYHYDRARRPGLRLIRPDGSGDHQLVAFEPALEFFRPHFWAPAPAWSPDGRRLVYSKLERYDRYYLYGDLYLYDLETGKERKLTHKARAYHPVFFPDGKRLLFAKQRWGEASPALAVLDLESGEETILQEFPNDFLIDAFAISPDGSQIALSAWRWGGFQDIYLMPAGGGELTPITQDRATDLDPVWSPDGRFLLFSSDRDGINNLYAYELATGKFFKVTSVTSGAFAPDLSPDGGKIVYVGYTVEGYDLRVMEFDPSTWREAEFVKEELPEPPGGPEGEYRIHPYDPGPALRPKLWLPILTSEGAGLLTFGADWLFHHNYSLVLGYNRQEKRPFYSFSYTTDRGWSTLSLELAQDGEGSRQRLRVTLPLVEKLAHSQEFSLGYESRDFGRGESAFTLSWQASWKWGLDLFHGERRVKVEGKFSDGFHRKLVLDWRERLRLPLERANELALKLTYGWSDLAENFALGGNAGQFMLRGLVPGALRGRQALAGSLECRFPIAEVERGLGLWPLFLNRIEGSLFLDLGQAGERFDWHKLRFGIGGELRPQLILGYAFPVKLRLGLAWGLDEPTPRVCLYLALGEPP